MCVHQRAALLHTKEQHPEHWKDLQQRNKGHWARIAQFKSEEKLLIPSAHLPAVAVSVHVYMVLFRSKQCLTGWQLILWVVLSVIALRGLAHSRTVFVQGGLQTHWGRFWATYHISPSYPGATLRAFGIGKESASLWLPSAADLRGAGLRLMEARLSTRGPWCRGSLTTRVHAIPSSNNQWVMV